MLTKRQNALLFVCGMIEYVRRRTKATYTCVVHSLASTELQHLYEFADIYHCENPHKVCDEVISRCGVPTGTEQVDTRVHAYKIAEVYMYLVDLVCKKQKKTPVQALLAVYTNKRLTAKLSDYSTEYYKKDSKELYGELCDNV